jgi:hypothetical protein
MGFFSRLFGRGTQMEDVTEQQGDVCSGDAAKDCNGTCCTPQKAETSPFLVDDEQSTDHNE